MAGTTLEGESVAVSLTAVGKVGLNAWCAEQKERKAAYAAKLKRYEEGRSRTGERRSKHRSAFTEGARRTLEDVRRRGAWKSSENDAVYESMLQKAAAAGVKPVEV